MDGQEREISKRQALIDRIVNKKRFLKNYDQDDEEPPKENNRDGFMTPAKDAYQAGGKLSHPV